MFVIIYHIVAVVIVAIITIIIMIMIIIIIIVVVVVADVQEEKVAFSRLYEVDYAAVVRAAALPVPPPAMVLCVGVCG